MVKYSRSTAIYRFGWRRPKLLDTGTQGVMGADVHEHRSCSRANHRHFYAQSYV
jgi:hypothetical protein